MKLIVHAACCLIAAAISWPAFAEEEQRRTVVSYRDLNLANEEGVDALDRRVKRAIRRVCGSQGVELWERQHQRACVKRATLDTNKQVAKAIENARTRAGVVSPPPER